MPSPKRSTRRPAATVAAKAPSATPYASPAMVVLEELEIQNAVSNLEARLDSIEIDVARHSGSRDDDARRVAGEMAVMKARVEDALQAFAGTAEELRELCRSVETRLEGVVAEQLGGEHPATPGLRAELRAGIDGVMAGVGDVLESLTVDVRGRIDALGDQMSLIQDGMIRIAEHVGTLAPLADRMADLEAKLASRDA